VQRGADPITAGSLGARQEFVPADARLRSWAAMAQEVFVVAEANEVADACSEPRSRELPGLDRPANGLFVGTNTPGHPGDGQDLAGVLTGEAYATIRASTDRSHQCVARRRA
jgi:hypothetical protein